MKHWKKGLQRITAIALAVMMAGTTVDASALTVLAEEATEVTCNHVCDEACGGTETASGSAITGCTHVHDEECGYVEELTGYTICDHSDSEHTTATDNGNGTHSFTCTVCGATDAIENHSFDTDNTCVCGAKIEITGMKYCGEDATYDESTNTYTVLISEDTTSHVRVGVEIVGKNFEYLPENETETDARILIKEIMPSEEFTTYPVRWFRESDFKVYVYTLDRGYWASYQYSNDGGETWSEEKLTVQVKRSYSVYVDETIENGTVTADKTTATEDETVTLTATPATGYILGSWTVTDPDGLNLTVENNQFTMPGSAVTVSASFVTCNHSGEAVCSALENVITASCKVCEEIVGTATITAQNGTYNRASHEATVEKTDILANTELTVAYYEGGILLGAAPVNAGTYTAKITYGGVTASVEYAIAKANPTYTAPTAMEDLVYNGSAQELVTAGTATGGTMQYSLEENGTYSGTVPTGTNAGSYTVWYKVVGDASHNDTAPLSVEVTIARKPVTVTADNASKTYGETDPTLTYTFDQLEGNDSLTGTLSRETGETAGTYAITQGTLTNENNPNYNISFVEGTFTINKATAPAITEPTATAITYGQKLSVATLSDSNWKWVNGDTVPATSGNYDAYIEVDDSNYDYAGVNGYDADTHRVVRGVQVQLNRATLTITARSYSIKVGGTLPAYGYEVAGLVNNDALPVEVTASCSATNSNTVGTYDITVSGALSTDLYEITYVNGTLTITEKDVQQITASDVTLTYGEIGKKIADATNGDGAITYTVATGTDVISVDTNGNITAIKAGTATVTINAAETADYAAAVKTVMVIVNKAKNAPNMPSATINAAYAVETVGAVTLPTGWAWAEDDASKALIAGEAVTATAVYNGADMGNYETETVTVAITRSACNHSYTSEVTKQPTVDAEGVRTYTCSACGYSYTEAIDKLAPTTTPGGSSGRGYYPPYTPSYPTPTPVPTAPTATVAPTVAPAYHPENTWVTSETYEVFSKAEKQYDVLLGTSAKAAAMVETMEVGDTIDLNFYGVKNWKKNNYTYKWISSDESVAVVDKAGVVTMLDEGIAIINLELVYKETGEKLSVAPILVGVPEAVYDVFIGTSTKEANLLRELALDKTVDLNFYGVKNWKKDDYEYEWISSNEEVAIVNKAGVVTAKAPGMAVIRLKLKHKATGEYLVVAPVVLTVPEKEEQ